MHRVARLADISPDHLTPVDNDGTKILLLRHGDQVRAFAATCPHADAPLEQGVLCNGRIICPWHKATFSVADGGLVEPPALQSLETYEVEIQTGDIWISNRPTPRPPASHQPETPTDDLQILVIGGGAAGAAGVAALREFGCNGRIVLLRNLRHLRVTPSVPQTPRAYPGIKYLPPAARRGSSSGPAPVAA
jgi:nitrite reductase/ring-hydroxylating ferredoxin subunit